MSLPLLLMLAAAPAQDVDLEGQGFLGLSVRDIKSGHTVVSWIYPGPLHGTGISAPASDIFRPDLLVAVDGQALNAETFAPYIQGLAPGTTVTLQLRRSKARGGTIPEELNHEEEVRTLEVALASREQFSGTVQQDRGHGGRVVFDGQPLLCLQDEFSDIAKAIAEHGLTEPLDTLTGVFADYLERNDDFHSLSRVRAPFEDPFCLPELEQLVTGTTEGVPADPVGVARALLVNLDIDLGRTPEDATLPVGRGSLEGPQSAATPEACLSFLRVPGETFYLSGPETQKHVEVIRQSMKVDWEALANDFAGCLTAGSTEEITSKLNGDAAPLAEGHPLAGSVEGDVLHTASLADGMWLVVGGGGANRYDMAKVHVVVDSGGDDEYYASDLRIGSRHITDLAGNDRYTGTPDQGPGGALYGVSVIDDRGGNDRYEGELLSCGAAMFGISLLLDRGGNDVYVGNEWSLGAACYGAGMLFDLGSGNDEYLGEFLCEGVGGPRGFGCIVDEGGRDLYRANGPKPSAYGTAAVAQSFSQGVGFGYRQYAAGGIGMISDLGGDDRYEAGEFAQGGAYYWGLGILHDAAGRDLYYGNRYGQGFGVHQAAGILVDDAGDDTYWSMTAASQGAAWDVGVGMLLDRSGDDSYQCDGLGQGGASMQGIAYLLDLDGRDRYVARGGGIQGGVGGNSYHYDETGAFSFALLMDLGGDPDVYSTGRAQDAVSLQGALREDAPANSTLHGLVIDR